MIISFFLNGLAVETDAPPHVRASELLKDEFQIRSVKRNCGGELCGTCLVLLDDRPVHSCMLPAFELRFREVWTMEGLSTSDGFSDIVSGFKSAGVKLCSICAPARAVAIEALLKKSTRPTAEQVRETSDSVRCGCSSVHRIQDAVIRSARIRERRLHGA